MFNYYSGSISKVLESVYPEYDWNQFIPDSSNQNPYYYASVVAKSQHQLYNTLRNLLPHLDVYHNYKHPDVYSSDTTKRLELDVYIPSLGLGFEYQGKQHYEDNPLFGDKETHQKRVSIAVVATFALIFFAAIHLSSIQIPN